MCVFVYLLSTFTLPVSLTPPPPLPSTSPFAHTPSRTVLKNTSPHSATLIHTASLHAVHPFYPPDSRPILPRLSVSGPCDPTPIWLFSSHTPSDFHSRSPFFRRDSCRDCFLFFTCLSTPPLPSSFSALLLRLLSDTLFARQFESFLTFHPPFFSYSHTTMGAAISCFDNERGKQTPYQRPTDQPGQKRSRKIVGVGGSAHTVVRSSSDAVPTATPPVTEPKKPEEEKPLVKPPVEEPTPTPPVDEAPREVPVVPVETAEPERPEDPQPNNPPVLTEEEEAKVDKILDDLNNSEEPVAVEIVTEQLTVDTIVKPDISSKDMDALDDSDAVPDSDPKPVIEVEEQVEIVTTTIVADVPDDKDELIPEPSDQPDAENDLNFTDAEETVPVEEIQVVEKNETVPVTEIEDVDPVSDAPYPTDADIDNEKAPELDVEDPIDVIEPVEKDDLPTPDPTDVPPVDVPEMSSIDTRRALFDRAEDRLPEVREIRRDVLDPVTNELISLEEYRQRQMDRAQGVVRERVEKFEGIDEERSRQIAEHNAIEAARTEAIVKTTWTFKRRKGNDSTPEKSASAIDFSLGPLEPSPTEETVLDPVGAETIEEIDEPVAVKEPLGDILPTKDHHEEETTISERMKSLNNYSLDDHSDTFPKEPEEPQPI